MNVSQKPSGHFLGSKVRDMERLLMDWANAATEYPFAPKPFGLTAKDSIARSDAEIGRLIQRYPEFFDSLPVPSPPSDAESKIHTSHWELVARTQRFLRLAWDTSDQRQKEWYIFKARDEYRSLTVVLPLIEARLHRTASTGGDLAAAISQHTDEEDAVQIQPPAFTPFEQVMYHFQRLAERARRCGNPECPAPYFFATKKGQKYCGSKCSAPAQRKQKLEWWRKHGNKGGLKK